MQKSVPQTSIIVLFLIFGLFTSTPSFSQSNNAEAALYNIGIGAVFSGIGAVINKKPEEKFGKVLLKGMAQGALGGYLVYESKILIGKIAKYEKLEYGWPAKLVNSAGISIIENAASNRNFWEQWNIHIGFNRIEFHTGEEFKIRYRIMPAALLLTAYSAFGNKLELEKSLKTGVFIFSDEMIYNEYVGFVPAGMAIGPAIILNSKYSNGYHTLSHELIHVYQYHDFNFLNTYIKKPLKELNEASVFFRELNKIFYYDIQAPFGRGLYLLETHTADDYYDNFFEHEAGYYSH